MRVIRGPAEVRRRDLRRQGLGNAIGGRRGEQGLIAHLKDAMRNLRTMRPIGQDRTRRDGGGNKWEATMYVVGLVGESAGPAPTTRAMPDLWPSSKRVALKGEGKGSGWLGWLMSGLPGKSGLLSV